MLQPAFTDKHQQDASEFFIVILEHPQGFLPKPSNYILNIEELVTCGECKFLRKPTKINNSILMLEYSDARDIDLTKLIHESFGPSKRLTKCESDIYEKTNMHDVERKLIEIPDILTIQINRCLYDERGASEDRIKNLIEEKLDLKFCLG